MNILLINHYAGSPAMGMAYRPYYLSQEWIKSGHTVTILVANNSHIRQYNPQLTSNFKEENIDGINYVWVNTPTYCGNGFGRIKNIFAFVWKILRKAKYLSKKYSPDAVIASSTYPSDNYIAKKIAKLSGAKYFYEVHDLWPLSPMELGGMSKYHPFIMLMQHGENFAYKNVDAVISMLPNTKEHMKKHGLDLKKWNYIPNGVILDEWYNQADLNKKTTEEIATIKLKFSKIVAYTGKLGLANALDSFVLASKKVADVAFVLVGKGPEEKNLKQLIEIEKITNTFILQSVNKQEIPSLLNKFDFLYIGLQNQPLFRFGISPNKLIDYMMSGKPIIQAIKAGNNVVKEVGCGLDIQPENPDAIVDAIKKLQNISQKELKLMGKNGQQFVLKNHNYKVLANEFINVISM